MNYPRVTDRNVSRRTWFAAWSSVIAERIGLVTCYECSGETGIQKSAV